MKKTKILWGVCGIGNGHTFRQLPIIEHFAENSEIVIFAYGESLDFYTKRFENAPHIAVEPVAVPYYIGDKDGLDFKATWKHPVNQNKDFTGINNLAMTHAADRIGKPDIVISDYEPVCAQYGYAHNAPLVTIDQQSKYLGGVFPQPLNGHYFQDEIARLRMFFPKAETRLACSFFRVDEKSPQEQKIELYPSILSDRITHLKHTPDPSGKVILAYMSSQQPFPQSNAEIASTFAKHPKAQFHIFGKSIKDDANFKGHTNIIAYNHGDPRFHDVFERCNGLLTTAGHSLMSEAMHLGIPVCAVPLPLYEQQMNAHIVDANGFGMSRPFLDKDVLDEFIGNIPIYSAAIAKDDRVLLRGQGKDPVIKRLEKLIYA